MSSILIEQVVLHFTFGKISLSVHFQLIVMYGNWFACFKLFAHYTLSVHVVIFWSP